MKVNDFFGIVDFICSLKLLCDIKQSLNSTIAQSAGWVGTVEYTNCFSAKG